MSAGGRKTQVLLEGLLSEEPMEVMKGAVVGQRNGRAGDLRLLSVYPDPQAERREVSALGRLVGRRPRSPRLGSGS